MRGGIKKRAALLGVSFWLTAAPVRADLLLYTPDVNPGNLGALSSAVSRYLTARHLDVSFQAFARYDDFMTELRARHPAFLSAPAWVEGEPESAPLQTLARPLRNGRPSYRKALLVGESIKSPQGLRGASIALAAHGCGNDILRDLLASLGMDADSVRIIAVPKDIDALLALGFGQVDAALVNAGQLERLAAINPRAADDIRTLALSDEVPFPLIYATTHASTELVADMIDSLAGISDHQDGVTVLGLLGYDRLEILGARSMSGQESRP